MTKFIDIFCSAKKLDLAEQMGFVQDLLTGAITNAGFAVYAQRESMPVYRERILIGVAPYSSYDFQLLDNLAEATKNGLPDNVRIEVFDVMACEKMADFEQYIPGLGNVYHIPVVGIWSNGILVSRGSGAPARELLGARLGFKPNCLNLHPCLPTTSRPPTNPLT